MCSHNSPEFSAKLRNSSITFRPSTTSPGGLLTIRGARYSAEYFVLPSPCGFAGRAFKLVKMAGHRGDTEQPFYNVMIADLDGDDHSDCDCAGHIYRPNQPGGCKHIAAMQAVLASGWLSSALPAVPAPVVEEPAPSSASAASDTILVWCSECDAAGVPGRFVPGRFQLCLKCIAKEEAVAVETVEPAPSPASAVEPLEPLEPSPSQIAERIISVWNRIFEAEDAARKVAEQRRAWLATMPARFAAETC
jgi:hypothetical protein